MLQNNWWRENKKVSCKRVVKLKTISAVNVFVATKAFHHGNVLRCVWLHLYCLRLSKMVLVSIKLWKSLWKSSCSIELVILTHTWINPLFLHSFAFQKDGIVLIKLLFENVNTTLSNRQTFLHRVSNHYAVMEWPLEFRALHLLW